MDARRWSVLFIATFVLGWPAFASPAEALTVAAGATPPTPMALAQITTADAGKRVRVQATVVGSANFSQGFRFEINDGTGQVALVIWADDWDYIRAGSGLNTGAVVSVTGAVNVYEGKIEIEPDRGGDVKVVTAVKPAARRYILGGLTGNDHNAVVQVDGVIADIQPFVLGTSLLVYDASGAQKVTLYDVVARRIAKQTKLRVGQSVSIVGRVRARRYYGVDIVVALPQDVSVTQAVTVTQAESVK